MVGKYQWKFLIKICPNNSLLTLSQLNNWPAQIFTRTQTIGNGILNIVGLIWIPFPIIRFAFFYQKTTSLKPACLMYAQYLQAVEMFISIAFWSRVQFRAVNLYICQFCFSTTITLQAFFFVLIMLAFVFPECHPNLPGFICFGFLAYQPLLVILCQIPFTHIYQICMICFGSVLCHINRCRLFNVKSCFYI